MLVAIGHYLVNPSPSKYFVSVELYRCICHTANSERNDVEQLVLQYSLRGIPQRNWFFVPVRCPGCLVPTLPIVQASFGGASPYFLFGNLLVVPFMTMIWAI